MQHCLLNSSHILSSCGWAKWCRSAHMRQAWQMWYCSLGLVAIGIFILYTSQSASLRWNDSLTCPVYFPFIAQLFNEWSLLESLNVLFKLYPQNEVLPQMTALIWKIQISLLFRWQGYSSRKWRLDCHCLGNYNYHHHVVVISRQENLVKAFSQLFTSISSV